ncbi:MAG: ECF transporter S component [Clostridium sp.]
MQIVKSNYYKNNFTVRKMVIAAMFSSISIFLGITRLGFINIPPVSATIMHIPVIIAAIIEGPIVGAIVGFIFGVFSMYQAITTPTITSFIFLNPIIAILPRVLIGFTSYYAYAFLSKGYNRLGISMGAIIGTASNTFLVLSITYLFYANRLATVFKIDPSTVGKFLAGIGVTNGIPEILISTLITLPVVLAIQKIKKQKI